MLHCSRHTRVGGQMWCWRPPQIKSSSGLRRCCSSSTIDEREHGFDAVSFRTIRTDINGPFLLSKCFIVAAIAHDYEIGCGAGGHPKSSHHQDRDSNVTASTIDKESMALMQCPSLLSAPALMGHFYSLKATLQPPHTSWRSDVVLAATPNQIIIRTETVL